MGTHIVYKEIMWPNKQSLPNLSTMGQGWPSMFKVSIPLNKRCWEQIATFTYLLRVWRCLAKCWTGRALRMTSQTGELHSKQYWVIQRGVGHSHLCCGQWNWLVWKSWEEKRSGWISTKLQQLARSDNRNHSWIYLVTDLWHKEQENKKQGWGTARALCEVLDPHENLHVQQRQRSWINGNGWE